ncbi:Gfo/Idh/MocA family oxidoreductase [Nonomuraea sp. NBC_01738]|uniref:Gfo/Idh/MocA family protein n=1 Tax=Nonomuraea sp. NBC_01738 TaxID=2976003 RepID=UPI002E12214A|nr:Gfo/Idh/MocA family oxidoreductase [Nonomuraea sp. NBC_01738]
MTVAVGLAGAGPWARAFHAPVFAAGPETRLAGVWSRHPANAADLAASFGTRACGSFAELLERCEAVVFAMPPDAQAELAARAARAGRAVLLEKPVALDVAGAEALAAAVDAAGVPSMVVLTNRFRPGVRDFLARAACLPLSGGRACQLTNEFRDGTFAHSPWRTRGGVLYNTGPHGLDLLDAALGPIKEITSVLGPADFHALTCRHEGGAVSQLTICGAVPGVGKRTVYELYGTRGELRLDLSSLAGDAGQTRATLRAEFAEAVRQWRPHPVDVRRGLHLQRLLAQVAVV